jgi:septum formation protein
MLVLASTSAYRRILLERLRIPFETERPDVDETADADESPIDLAKRLAETKARVVATRRPMDWVIGSDQVADLDGRNLGKPGGFANAVEQLSACSGRTVVFHTAVCLRHDASNCTRPFADVTRVRFRRLDALEIERYLQAEQPWDCAGSFKSEGLGIALFEAIETRDLTALVGLPLIALAQALREAGFNIP